MIDKIRDAVRISAQILFDAENVEETIDEKEGCRNFVTAYDKKVQEELRKRLLAILPEAKFVGEEEESFGTDLSGYVFIVDPIDGTTNFIKGYPVSAVSVALILDGNCIAGVVFNPFREEMFWAEKEKGAYLNGKPIHVSSQPLSNGLVLFGTSPYYKELWKPSFEMAYHYFQQALDVRRSGSAAVDLCDIACGRAEMYFELRLAPWDFAAGALIIEEAGGTVTTAECGAITLNRPCSILATGSGIEMVDN